MVGAVAPGRAVELLRGGKEEVERKSGTGAQERPPSPADGHFVPDAPEADRHDDEQVDIAVGAGAAVGVGAEEDDLERSELVDEHPQVWKQVVGDSAHWIARVAEHLLADARVDGEGASHGRTVAD